MVFIRAHRLHAWKQPSIRILYTHIIFKVVRRDMVSHPFESPRRHLGGHKARQDDAIWFIGNFKGVAWRREKNEKKKKEKEKAHKKKGLVDQPVHITFVARCMTFCCPPKPTSSISNDLFPFPSWLPHVWCHPLPDPHPLPHCWRYTLSKNPLCENCWPTAAPSRAPS